MKTRQAVKIIKRIRWGGSLLRWKWSTADEALRKCMGRATRAVRSWGKCFGGDR
jgi:hypothetical protein